MMILYGFGSIFKEGIGETRDLRVEWALEEMDLPYRVQGIDQTKGELKSPEFSKISPFNQIPVLDDEGFVLSESVAILLYLAEKSGKLIPLNLPGRMKVTQWCLAAVNTLEPTLFQLDLMEMGFFSGDRKQILALAGRWLDGFERQLAGKPWMTGPDFTVADILTACVLRMIRKTDLLEPYPNLNGFFLRAQARPAWQRALANYARRLGVTVERIR